MFCTKCGAKLSKEQNFCIKCGNQLAVQDSKASENQTASASSSVEGAQEIEETKKVETEIITNTTSEVSTVEDVEENVESVELTKANDVVEPEKVAESQIIENVDLTDQTLEIDITNEEKSLELYCSKCGIEVKENAKFCTKCGESLEATGKIVNQKPEISEPLQMEKVKKAKVSKNNKIKKNNKENKKETKSVFKKILTSLILLLIVIVSLVVSAILYTHYSQFEMVYETIDYEKYIEENIKEMIEIKSDDTYEITVGSDLINSALNSNLDMINKVHKEISINKTYFDMEIQRLYFTIAYKNFDLHLSSNVDLKLDEQSVEINLDEFKAGGKNIPIPGFITSLFPSDLFKISYDVEQIPDFIIANEIEYDKSNMKVNFEVDYKSLAKDLAKYKSIDNIDENIVNIYHYSSDPYKQTLGEILNPYMPLTADNVKSIIDLYEDNANVLKDIFVAFDDNAVDTILKDYSDYINITIDTSSLVSARKYLIRENFFAWISRGTAPGVDVTVGDSLDYMVSIYGDNYYYDEWNDYDFYSYDYLNDSAMESGGVIFLTPYSYYSYDYNNITIIEIYTPYDFMGINLSMTIPEIEEILGEPDGQFYDYETGYYKTVYRSGSYLVSFHSDDKNSESYYADIRKY